MQRRLAVLLALAPAACTPAPPPASGAARSPQPRPPSVEAPSTAAPIAPLPKPEPDLVDEVLASCAVRAAGDWVSGPIRLRATPDGEPFATLWRGADLEARLDGERSALVAKVEGWTLHGFITGEHILQTKFSVTYESIFTPDDLPYAVTQRSRRVEGFVIAARPRGFHTDLTLDVPCEKLTFGTVYFHGGEDPPASRFGWLGAGTRLSVSWTPDKPGLYDVDVDRDVRVVVLEQRGARTQIEWRRCDGRLKAWIDSSLVLASPPAQGVAWGPEASPCKRATEPSPPSGGHVKCREAVPLVAVVSAGPRRVGAIPAGGEAVVLRRERGMAYVATPHGWAGADADARLAVDDATLRAACDAAP